MKTYCSLLLALLIGVSALDCLEVGVENISVLDSAEAQAVPVKSTRPPATKSSNTWICILVTAIVGIIVFFIGRMEKMEYESEYDDDEAADMDGDDDSDSVLDEAGETGEDDGSDPPGSNEENSEDSNNDDKEDRNG